MTSKILLEPETEIEGAHEQGTACSPCKPESFTTGRLKQYGSVQQPNSERSGQSGTTCSSSGPDIPDTGRLERRASHQEPHSTPIDHRIETVHSAREFDSEVAEHRGQRSLLQHLSNGRNGSQAEADPRTTGREVLAVAWPVMLSYVAVGMPCGVLAAKSGMTPLMAGILSATYLSGGGQFMISNLWMSGTPMLSLLASVAAISARFALYSASLAPHLKRFGKRESLAITCCFSEEAYGVTLSKLSEGPSWTAKHALTLNLELLFTWTVSVVAGAFIGGAVDIPTALASFAMTSLFIYLLWSQPHTAGNGIAAAAAAVTVVACKWNGLSGAAVPVAALVGVATALASQTALQGHEKPSEAEGELLEEENA